MKAVRVHSFGPSDVMVLKDLSPVPSADCADEGRAMMQLIHDVAPGSPLAFYTAFVSQEDFAAGIRALADAGSQVIVDDVIYFAEPMFEDGIIAQAVDDVYKDGVASLQAGGGIVLDSTPDGEYAECFHKMRALLRAIELAESIESAEGAR